MKSNNSLQSQPIKSRLPNIGKKHLHLGISNNHSLKKLILHNNVQTSSSEHVVNLLPKLAKKMKQKDFETKKTNDTSIDRNFTPWYLPHGHLKKRQKLQTQGQSAQQLSEEEDSFISLTNKIISTNEAVKDTMMDFRKKIQANKLLIKKEIEKKNKENRESGVKDQSLGKQASLTKQQSAMKKKRANSSRMMQKTPSKQIKHSKKTVQTPTSKSKVQGSFNQSKASRNPSRNEKKNPHRKRQKTQLQYCNQTEQLEKKEHKQRSLPKRKSEGLFTELNVILDDKMKPEGEKLRHQEKKLRLLLAKLYKFKKHNDVNQKDSHDLQLASLRNPSHSLSDQLLHLQSSTDTLSPKSYARLKGQTNYNQWNKLNLSSTSQIAYRKSSFEEELKKISEYTDRNDASLEKYLGMRKQLLKLGFQVKLIQQNKSTKNSNVSNQTKS